MLVQPCRKVYFACGVQLQLHVGVWGKWGSHFSEGMMKKKFHDDGGDDDDDNCDSSWLSSIRL